MFPSRNLGPIISTLLLLLSVPSYDAMLVKHWGTGSQLRQLAYATYDLFKGAFDILTAAQNDAYPVEDFKWTVPQEWRGFNASLEFHAYNGWLDSFTLETNTSVEFGKLRRFIMTRAENSLTDKQIQHEIFMCADCIVLKAKGFHFGFEAAYTDYETWGTVHNGPVQYSVSFQMKVITTLSENSKRPECTTELEPLTVTLDPATEFSAKVQGLQIFSFLSDHLDDWLRDHFNTTVLDSLTQRMDNSLRKILRTQNNCKIYLIS